MKKQLLVSFVTLSMSTSTFSQNVNIPDANFKAYLVGNNLINTNGDSEIQVSEATAFTGYISCPNMSIANLTGIEAFTNIIGLYCQLNALINLNVSNNASLQEINCFSNQLTGLNVNNLIDLQDLRVSNNQLTSLDVSNNPDLYVLHCNNNLLTSLNVANSNNTIFVQISASNNPNLSCIQVDDIAYSNANWVGGNFMFDVGVNFSENCSGSCDVIIPDANFKAYLVGNTAINTNGDSEIQCSEATSFNGAINCNGLNISDLTGIEAFTSLTTLNCFNNQLTSLNLTYNYDLVDINCNNNPITSLSILNSAALLFLYCQNNQLTSLNTSNNFALSSLACNNNLLTSLDLSNNIALSSLACYNNPMASLDVSNNTALTQLQCYSSQLTSLNVSNNTALSYLSCYDNLLTYLNVKNSNNTNFTGFIAFTNPNLTCIEVDDATYSTTNWEDIDATASFSENCTSSINENEQLNISLYPNPTSSHLTIESDEKITQIQIFNILGELVQSETTNSFSVNELSVGVYLIKINTSNGVVTTRFVKEK